MMSRLRKIVSNIKYKHNKDNRYISNWYYFFFGISLSNFVNSPNSLHKSWISSLYLGHARLYDENIIALDQPLFLSFCYYITALPWSSNNVPGSNWLFECKNIWSESSPDPNTKPAPAVSSTFNIN